MMHCIIGGTSHIASSDRMIEYHFLVWQIPDIAPLSPFYWHRTGEENRLTMVRLLLMFRFSAPDFGVHVYAHMVYFITELWRDK